MLPPKLKNFSVRGDGESWLGQVEEVTLPKLAKKVEGFRHGGMLGEVEAEMGLEKIELTVKCGGFVLGALRSFGRTGVDGSLIRFNGAYQEEGVGAVLAAELEVRGVVTEWDPGNGKVADKTEHGIKMTCSYLRWTVNGAVLIEIDLIACVWIQDGVDRMAEIRAALGV